MPRPEYFSLRLPTGTIDRIKALADRIGKSQADWCIIACRRYMIYAVHCDRAGDDVIQLPRSILGDGLYAPAAARMAIMVALFEAERKAPRPPVIDPVEEQAAKGAVIVDAMEDDNG